MVRRFKIQEALLLYSRGLVSFGRAAEVNQRKKNVAIALGAYYIL
jgi:predicted HTH domain antitoxin